MPRIGLISDIHSNREALEAVLADTVACGVDALVCLGDIVGYGPDPGACLDIVAGACDACIRGNHDEAVLHSGMRERFSPRAWRSIEASSGVISEGGRMLIRSMRERSTLEGVSLAHGSFGTERFRYLYDAGAAALAFDDLPTSLGAVGHTHIPSVFIESERGVSVQGYLVSPGVEYTLPRGSRAIVNPGSVGQPRDRNPDASWGVLDTERRSFQVRRVEYDIEAVRRKMDALGLPGYLSLRLTAGV